MLIVRVSTFVGRVTSRPVVDRIADHIGGALLSLGPLGMRQGAGSVGVGCVAGGALSPEPADRHEDEA